MTKWARCNYDGKPISASDLEILQTFAIWLSMDETDQRLAMKLDPQWRAFLKGEIIQR